MFKVLIHYPSAAEEFDIVQRTTAPQQAQLERVLAAREILALQELVRRVPCADTVLHYALQLTRSTRVGEGEVPRIVQDYVAWGAGPRATQFLVLAGKARAALQGRHFVSVDDIRAVAHPVLRHRVLTNFNAEADGVRSDTVIEELLRTLPEDGRAGPAGGLAERVYAPAPDEDGAH